MFVVVAVALCASVLVPLAGDPPLLETEPAAAHHCDQYQGDWAAVCELVHACTNSGGTVTGGRCVYPTTTTTTLAPWLTCKYGYDWKRSICKTAPPTTTTTTTVAPWLTCRYGYDWERSVCKTAPPTTTTTTTVAPWLTCRYGYDWERSVCKTAPPPTTTTTTTTTTAPVRRVSETCHAHGSHYVNNECHTHPTDKACGETVWVHTGDLSNLHTTYEVTASPPCNPPTTTTTTTVPVRTVKPTKVTCDPKTGEHRHEGTSADTCHLNHTTVNTCAHLKPPGQHLFGHDGCHSGHSHTTCPAGQARAPFPPAWIYKFEPYPVVFTHPGDVWNYEQPAWVEANAHTGCHKPEFAKGTKLTIPWGDISSPVQNAITSAVSEAAEAAGVAGKVGLDVGRTFVDVAKIVHIAICWEPSLTVTAIAGVTQYVATATTASIVGAPATPGVYITGTVAAGGVIVGCRLFPATKPTITTTTTTTTAKPVGCSAGEHRHGQSTFHTGDGDCHSHVVPLTPPCGAKYMQRSGSGHIWRYAPACPTTTTTTVPPSCPTGERLVEGSCLPVVRNWQNGWWTRSGSGCVAVAVWERPPRPGRIAYSCPGRWGP